MRKWKILMCLLLCSGAVFVPEYGSTKVYAEVKAADYLLPDADIRYYTACSGKFSSDRTIEEYVEDIWKLEKVTVPSGQED